MSSPRDASSQCRNLNHGRMNVQIHFCPDCGKRFEARAVLTCNTQKHNDYMKQRFNFCIDCGTKLRK